MDEFTQIAKEERAVRRAAWCLRVVLHVVLGGKEDLLDRACEEAKARPDRHGPNQCEGVVA